MQQWEEKQGEGIVLPGIMTNYKAIVIKTVWHLHRHREIDQWSRIKSPWTDHTYRDAWYMIEVGLQSTVKNKLFKKWCWKKSYGEMYSKWELIPLWGFKDHSNMAIEITLREAYKIKGFIIVWWGFQSEGKKIKSKLLSKKED